MPKPPKNQEDPAEGPAKKPARRRTKPAIQEEIDTPASTPLVDVDAVEQHSFRSLLTGRSSIAWNFKIKLAELFAAFLIFAGTVYVGLKANDLSRRFSEQQYEATLFQAYIETSIAAGIDTEREWRMFRTALDLHGLLLERDQKYALLKNAMPVISNRQFAELLQRRPAETDRLFQLFARRLAASSSVAEGDVVASSPYHIVIGTFRNRPEGIARATGLLRSAQGFLTRSRFRPIMNIVRNEDGFVLATLSGFSTREDVLATLDRERIRAQFPDAYASQSRGWATICSRRFEPCGTAPR